MSCGDVADEEEDQESCSSAAPKNWAMMRPEASVRTPYGIRVEAGRTRKPMPKTMPRMPAMVRRGEAHVGHRLIGGGKVASARGEGEGRMEKGERMENGEGRKEKGK